MKKLICIWGCANYGKSSSIKEFDKLLNNTFKKTISTIDEIGTYEDDIFQIYKINDLTVGIESQGDPNSRQKDSLKKFNKNSCDIIICASRTRGETVQTVLTFCDKNHYDCF